MCRFISLPTSTSTYNARKLLGSISGAQWCNEKIVQNDIDSIKELLGT